MLHAMVYGIERRSHALFVAHVPLDVAEECSY